MRIPATGLDSFSTEFRSSRMVHRYLYQSRFLRGTVALSPLLFLAVAVISGLSSRKLTGDTNVSLDFNQYKESAPVDDTVLRIVQLTPQGDLSAGDLKKEIVIVFNHPMVPLAKLDETTTGFIALDPPVRGNFRWYGSRVSAFVPSENYKPGTRYTVRVAAGIKALNARSLPAGFTSSFTTPGLKVNAVSPGEGARIAYEPEFNASFNYPVDLKEARTFTTVEADGKTIPIHVDYQGEEGRPVTHAIRVKVLQKLPVDAQIKFIVKQGLRPLGGNIPMEESSTTVVRTYGPMSVTLRNPPDHFQERWDYYIEFSNPVDRARAIKAIRFSPPLPPPESESEETTTLSVFDWPVRPSTNYVMTIESGLTDVYGNPLRGQTKFDVKLPAVQPRLSMESGHGVIEARMKQRLPVFIENLPEVTAEIGMLTIEDLQNQLADNGGIDKISLKKTPWKTALRANESAVLAFDLAPHLKNNRGWLAVRMTGKTADEDEDSRPVRYVQSTDLGLSVREAYDRSFIWVHSLTLGKPVAGAKAEAFDGKKSFGSCVTDAAGFCAIQKTSPAVFEKPFYTASHSESADSAFVMDGEHESPVYGQGISVDEEAASPALSGQIVFDRKLYRPGEKMFFKAVLALREKGQIRPLAGQTVKAVITNSQGTVVWKNDLTTTQEGGVWGAMAIPADAPLGHANIAVSYSIRRSLLDLRPVETTVRDTFQIEEFRPVTFSAELGGIQNVEARPALPVTLSGRYLFGAPMQNAPAEIKVMKRPLTKTFPGFPGFFFGDDESSSPWDYDGETSTLSYHSGTSGRLDVTGKYAAAIPLQELGQWETFDGRRVRLGRIYEMEVEGTVKDVDDKTITTQGRFTFYPGRAVFGIKVRERYQNFKRPFQLDLIAVTNDGRASAPVRALVRVESKIWKTIQTQGPANSVQRKNTLVRKTLRTDAVNVSGTSSLYQFQPTEAGQYIVTLYDESGNAYARAVLYAFGGGFVGWNFNDDDRVNLALDKTSYRPGETARVVIQAPFENATALVTLERESFYWQKTVTLKGGGEPVDVPITEQHSPNVFLSVMLIKPRAHPEKVVDDEGDEDIGRPQFKMGVIRINVDTSSRRLPLVLTSDKKDYGPRDNVIVEIKTVPGAEVSFSAADRAVLDLLHYRYEDPVGIFYADWPLGTRIFENRKALIRQINYTRKGENPGGGGEDEATSGKGGFPFDSEDGTRRDFRSTAHWDPKIVADASGVARVQFKLPDNLTSFRLMALAASAGRYASTDIEIRVRKAVVVQPLVPRFIRPGDELEIGAVVSNQTGRAGKFKVTLASPVLKTTAGRGGQMMVDLPNGATKDVTFRVSLDTAAFKAWKKVNGVTGAMDVEGSISAGTPETQDRVVFRFPVREHPVTEAFTIAGYADTTAEEGIKIPAENEILAGIGGLDVSLSSTALVGLGRGFQFFQSQPYFCLEQRGSAYLLAMTSGKLLEAFQYKPGTSDYDFSRIEELFTGELGRFQNQDGGFRPWKEHPTASSPYLSAYVALILQTAKKNGRSIPQNEYRMAMEYLKGYVARPGTEGYGYVIETFALIAYVRAVDGESRSPLQDFLVANQSKLSLRGKSYLAMSLAVTSGPGDKDTKAVLERIKNRMEFTTRKVSFKEEASGSYMQAYYAGGSVLGAAMRAFIQADPENPMIPKMVDFAMADSGRLWSDSHSSGVLALALHDYAKRYESAGGKDPEFQGEVTLAGRPFFTRDFKGRTEARFLHSAQFEALRKSMEPGVISPLVFKKSGSGRLYYTASFRYAPNFTVTKPRDEGMEVRREVSTLAALSRAGGTPARDFGGQVLPRGEMLLVRLTVTNPKPYFHFLLTDPIPSNLEIVNSNFAVESASLSRFLDKKRSDQGWWSSSPNYEYRDDRLVVTQDYLSAGVHEFFYLARPTLRGRASAPAARVSLMYEPEIFGRTGDLFQEVR